MKQEHLFQVIVAPHMSEKASIATEKHGVYVFKVQKKATKLHVKAAVEHLFKVMVDSVRIVNVKSKPKRFGKILGKSKVWKKAYVKLQAGQLIDFGANSN
jgi:large subunit ribosomal protein L23